MASFYQIEHSKSQLKYLKSDETRRDLPKRDTNSRNTMLRGENVIKFCRAPPQKMSSWIHPCTNLYPENS